VHGWRARARGQSSVTRDADSLRKCELNYKKMKKNKIKQLKYQKKLNVKAWMERSERTWCVVPRGASVILDKFFFVCCASSLSINFF
jgi:hypothetical protein